MVDLERSVELGTSNQFFLKNNQLTLSRTPRGGSNGCFSLRSRRECVPARTSVPNASAKSRAGREKNGGKIPSRASTAREFSPQCFARAPTPASYAGYGCFGQVSSSFRVHYRETNHQRDSHVCFGAGSPFTVVYIS